MSPNESQQLAKDYLSTLNDLRNQSDTDELSVVDEDNTTVSNGPNLPTQRLETDVSGHYVNPTYGILDFVIPNEWYG
jgi:hypothetical protein